MVLSVKFRQVAVHKNHYCKKSGAPPVGFDFERMCKNAERKEWISRNEQDKRFKAAEALNEPWLAKLQRMVKRTSKLSLDGRACKWGSQRGWNEQRGGWTRRSLWPWQWTILPDRCQCSVWGPQMSQDVNKEDNFRGGKIGYWTITGYYCFSAKMFNAGSRITEFIPRTWFIFWGNLICSGFFVISW